jgi:hypothetical protein
MMHRKMHVLQRKILVKAFFVEVMDLPVEGYA